MNEKIINAPEFNMSFFPAVHPQADLEIPEKDIISPK